MESLHANLAAGADTQNTGIVYFPSSFITVSGAIFVVQLWIQPSATGNPSAYLYSQTATNSNRVAGILESTGISFTRNSLMIDQQKLLLSGTGGEDRLQVHTLSYDASTNTYGQVSWAFNPSIVSVAHSISDPIVSTYVYYLEVISTTYTMRKWDTNLGFRDPAGVLILLRRWKSGRLQGPDLLLYGEASSTIEWRDKSAFTLTKTMTGPHQAQYFEVDNLDPSVFYVVLIGSPYGVVRILLGTSTYVQTHAIPPVAGQTQQDVCKLLTLGNMAYIGLIRFHETNLPFRIYAKADLTEIPLQNYVPVFFRDFTSNNLVAGLLLEAKKTVVHFGLQVQVSGVYNFQSWKAILDICVIRTLEVCMLCPAGYYIDLPGVPDNACLLYTKGPDITTQLVVSCQDPDCERCGSDKNVCTRCLFSSASPYLFRDACVSLAEIPDGFGADPTTMTVIPCTDQNCIDCRTDYRICARCNESLGYKSNSAQTCELSEAQALKVLSAIYDWRQQIGSITFDSEIEVTGLASQLNFSVIDLANQTKFTCEQLNCVKQVQSRGVSVTFNTTMEVKKGILLWEQSAGAQVRRKNDSRWFESYPVTAQFEVAIESVVTPIEFPITEPVRVTRALQMPGTLFFAAMYPTLTPLFDEIFARITVIAFYRSPPMTTLDLAIINFKNVTVLPFDIPNMFEWMLPNEKCRPSQMLDRYQYQCRFLENFGVDLTIPFFMLVLMLVLRE